VRPSNVRPLSPFYGYPVAVIAQWCAVSRRTAAQYKAGTRKPSRQALRLFTLHRDGRFLSDGWDGWAVHGDRLVDPDGNETTRGQLWAYFVVWQLVRSYALTDAHLAATLDRLSKSA
jgi:hypothetical protein